MKTITKTNFTSLVEEILNNLKAIGINVTTSPRDYYLEFNNRALKRYGRCEKKGNSYIIQINKYHNELSSKEDVMNTLIHEIIHSMPGCMNHKKVWQDICEKYNFHYHTHLSRTSPMKGAYKKFYEEQKAKNSKIKYYIVCSNCGHHYPRKNKSKFVESSMRNEKLICGVCGACATFTCKVL